VVPAEQDRPDIARKRHRWKTHQRRVDPRRLVFLDETWMKTNMAPLRGWGPRGRRLAASVPYGHWMTMTFIAALRCDRVEAPCVFDGPINGTLFTAYVEQLLAPTLAQGDIVILDNLGSHKGKAVRAAIPKGRGASLVPAALQPRPQSHRAALRQAQASAAPSRGTHPPRHLAPCW
jgi:DDE superfamily endonuclease